MKQIRLKQALESDQPRRKRAYTHKPGAFHLTANFRDKSIDQSSIALAGALHKHFAQWAIAHMLGTSTATVGKMVRCFYADHKKEAGKA